MQFFTLIDEFTGIEHIFLISELEKNDFEKVKEYCEEHIPHFSCSAVFRKGRPYITVDYGFGGCFKYAIPLDDLYFSGERLGDKLEVGDVITIILSNYPQEEVMKLTKKGFSLLVPLEDLIAYSFIYTEEMNQIYEFYKLAQRIKSRKSRKKKT